MSLSKENWVQVEGSTEEYFYRGKHIDSKSWASSSPPLDTYGYYGDNTVCTAQGKSENRTLAHEIRVPELIHVTDPAGAIGILRDCALKPGEKRFPGLEDLTGKLVWFSIPIDEKQKNDVLNSCVDAAGESINEATLDITTLRENLKEVFASSAAFDPKSRYGNYKFKFPIKELLEMYQDQCCEGKKPDRIILGTCCYRQEIMHIIGICPPNTIGKDKCPRLGEGDSSVIKEDTEGNFIWMPCSTGDKRKTIRRNGDVIQSGKIQYRRWDHVCFAVIVPQTNITLERHLMVLRDNITYCSGNKIVLRKNDLNLNEAIRRLVDSAAAETDNGSKSRLLIAAINMVSNYNGSLDEFIIGTLNMIVNSITIFPVNSTDIQPAIEKICELTKRKDFVVDLSPILQRGDDNKHTEFDSEAEISDMLSTTALGEGLSNLTGNNQMPSSTTK